MVNRGSSKDAPQSLHFCTLIHLPGDGVSLPSNSPLPARGTHWDNTALLLITAYYVVSQNMNVFVHDQAVSASIPGLKCVVISAVKTWSDSCSITAHSAMLQKQKSLITISTSHVLGVKSLEVRQRKGKETENSLVQSDLKTAIKWRGGKGLSKRDAFRLEWSSHCEAGNGM